ADAAPSPRRAPPSSEAAVRPAGRSARREGAGGAATRATWHASIDSLAGNADPRRTQCSRCWRSPLGTRLRESPVTVRSFWGAADGTAVLSRAIPDRFGPITAGAIWHRSTIERTPLTVLAAT